VVYRACLIYEYLHQLREAWWRQGEPVNIIKKGKQEEQCEHRVNNRNGDFHIVKDTLVKILLVLHGWLNRLDSGTVIIPKCCKQSLKECISVHVVRMCMVGYGFVW
jgi:hypothetical protein